MDEEQDFLTDFLLEDDEDSPLWEDEVVTPQSFLERYRELQHSMAVVDRADLEVIDEKTGKSTLFSQVRFSGGNTQRH